MLHNCLANIHWVPIIEHTQHHARNQSGWFHDSSNSKASSLVYGTSPSCGYIFVRAVFYLKQFKSALSPEEVGLIVMIWATEGQQAQRCVSWVRDGLIHMSAEEAEVLSLVKKFVFCFSFIFKHGSCLNSTEAENIVRLKAVLIKIVCWYPGQIWYCKLKWTWSCVLSGRGR